MLSALQKHPPNEGGRRTSGRICDLALAATLALTTTPLSAQPFGWFYGGSPSYPRYRPRRHTPEPPAPAEIPLPVPRPHFPSDTDESRKSVPSEPVGTAKDEQPNASPAATEHRTEHAPATPSATSEPATTAVPLPPPKPPELAATAAPSVYGPIKPPGAQTPREPSKAGPTPAEAQKPAVAPSGATTAYNPRQPADDPGCPGRLTARKVEAAPTTIGKQVDDRCTVVQPVRLTDLTLADGGHVDFPDKPTIACATADAFSAFVHDLLSPLAKGTYGAPVAAVWTGPGLECRSRDHIFGAKLSAHGQGLAVDIAQIKLGDGRLIAVGDPKSPEDQGFETAARAAGCGYFHTVLGPGTDSYHRSHWHFDLEPRGAQGDSKYCK